MNFINSIVGKIMSAQANSKAKSDIEKKLLGESLVKHKLIDHNQLEQALKRRTQVDKPIGSILIEMGFVPVDKMLVFLSRKFAVPPINLFKVNIEPEVLKLISRKKMINFQILPVTKENNTLTLAMVNPQDFMTISELEFTLGQKIKPMIAPFFMMQAALSLLSESYEGGLDGTDIENLAMHDAKYSETPPEMEKLFGYLIESGCGDMLLTAGVPPTLKMGSVLKRVPTVSLTPAQIEIYAKNLLSTEKWDLFNQRNELEIGMTYKDQARFRITFYRQRGSISIAMRHLPEKIPPLKELELPEWIYDYALSPQGLIIMAGPAGNGKSTTLSAMIDIINTNRRCNIITLEEPIEFLHKHKKSNINQREVGRDTESFADGLRGIFRQAPDVIVIGEMRDKITFETAIKAARTGHLVLTTMNAFDSTAVIQTIINMFPVDQQDLIRLMLADSLLLSLGQRLIIKKDGTGMVLALEKLSASHRTQNFIRENRVHQIRSQMESGNEEFIPLDVSLADHVKNGKISYDDALLYATNSASFKELVRKP
ncbi:MAG: PilT/PilU family type 4a pilus ATPase [Candidatus Muiribacteriota bacterium]